MSQSRAPRARRRTLGAAFGVLALAASATACSSGGGGIETPSLSVGIVAGIGASTFELGNSQQYQYFSQQGLNISVQFFSNDAQAELALQKGSVDVAFGSYAEFLDLGSSTVASDVQVVGEGYDAGSDTIGLVAAPNPPFATSDSVSQLAAGIQNSANATPIRVAVPDVSSPEFVALANWAIAQQSAINTSHSNMISMPGNQDQETTAQAEVAAVTSGSADTAVLQEPYLTQAVESGKVTQIADLDSGDAANMPVDGYFALSTFVQKNPHTLAAFAAGLSLSQGLGASRVAVETALEQAKLSKDVATTTQIGLFPTGIVPANLDNILNLMGSANLQVTGLSSTTLTSQGL